jgi:MOSC domain-containing protein YiiM
VAEVAHLFVCPGHRLPMTELEEVQALAHRGIRGCKHARPQSSRQVLLVDLETLTDLGLEPGLIKENVTVSGLEVTPLPPGTELKVGEAELRVTGVCEPCFRMDEIREGLKRELEGRRGVLCRVTKEGKIARGDRVEVMSGVEAQTLA